MASTFERGGHQMVQLLNYCVYCRKFDPVFILLAKNYQLMPVSAKALVLFDEFIIKQAPLPLSVNPGADYLLVQTIDKIRRSDQPPNMRVEPTPESSQTESEPGDTVANTPYLPAKFLFGGFLSRIESDTDQIQSIEKEFDPQKSAIQNLPGGTLSGAQLQFIEQVWKPARNRLTTAGFRMVANIGG